MSNRAIFEQDHNIFRENFRKFLEAEVKPHQEQWLKDRIVSREAWKKAGENGYLCMYVDEKWGGMGLKDFRYTQIQIEEMARIGESGFAMSLHSDVIGVYLDSFANDEQKARWMPGIISGEKILAVAMTEPGTGSDLKNIKTRVEDKGDYLLLNGAKTFISNGILSDIVIVAAQWEGKGMTLVVVERGMEGFKRGRKLDKMGMHSQDTAELFFEDVKVPKANILGQPGMGFMYLMQKLAQERIVCAIGAIAGAEYALEHTLNYVKERKAFGKPIIDFQNTRFKLADVKAQALVGRTFVDACIQRMIDGSMDADTAAAAKLWTTETLGKAVDECLQLHGGYGYMWEYPIARLYADARVQKIYGGTNEIMKEIITRALGRQA